MDGHERVLAMSDDDFERLVRLLESAFSAFAASFFFDGDSGNAIDVFDFIEEANDVDAWSELRTFATDAQQLVFFAFQGAPDSIISRWAEDHLEESGQRTVGRVHFIRKNVPTGRTQWVNRFSDLARTLGDIKTTHVFDEDLGDYKTVVRIDSFFVEGLQRAPSASSREYVTAALTRNELRRAIDVLRMADFRYENFDDDELDAEPTSETPASEAPSQESGDNGE